MLHMVQPLICARCFIIGAVLCLVLCYMSANLLHLMMPIITICQGTVSKVMFHFIVLGHLPLLQLISEKLVIACTRKVAYLS